MLFPAWDGSSDKVSLLLSKGAQVNSYVHYETCRGSFYLTPLHCALMTRQLETAHRLLDMGADARMTGFFIHPQVKSFRWEGNALGFANGIHIRDQVMVRMVKDVRGGFGLD